VPVLLLVPGAAPGERVRALDAGADDCLAKPVDADELQARLRAVRRRAMGHASPRQQVGRLVYDSISRSFHIGSQRVVLPPREHHLLELLMARPGQTLSKATLAERLCPPERMLSPDALEIYVHRLRRKLTGSGAVIQTLRGLGYLLEAEIRP
jgi:two-component system, OmpR family, response regulator TctD